MQGSGAVSYQVNEGLTFLPCSATTLNVGGRRWYLNSTLEGLPA